MQIKWIKPRKCKTSDKIIDFCLDKLSSCIYQSLEEKIDGHRVSVIKDDDGIRILSSLGKPKTLPWLTDVLKFMPNGTYLDGELHLEDLGSQSSDVSHALKADPNSLVFTAFDCLYLRGTEMIKETLHCRRLALQTVLSCLDQKNNNMMGRVRQAGVFSMGFSEIYNTIIEGQGEGVVIKNINSIYKEGSKDSNWIKVKGCLDVDVVITDCEGKPSEWRVRPLTFGEKDITRTGEYIEVVDDVSIAKVENICREKSVVMLSSTIYDAADKGKVFWPKGRHTDPWESRHVNLRYGYYDTEGNLQVVGSTGICGPKEDMQKSIGKVAKFKTYGEILKTGSMRHPVFIEFREDKMAEECVFNFKKGVREGA